ncbi:MAG: PDZ domain-containing protein, partial [Parvularculaceae bacterium]|nr:PDZ domain-containing protein [Parvularculaceae bacterium]
FLYSLGFIVGEEARLSEVLWGGPAFQESLRVGDQIVAVNGAPYSADVLQKAILAAKSGRARVELMLRSADAYRTVRFAWRGGLRYPHLERIEGTSDLLSAIYAPRAN